MDMAEVNMWIVIPTLILLYCSFAESQYPGYERRARADCYIPRGPHYERSIYMRAYGYDLNPLPAGYRITNGKRVVSVCEKDILGDVMMNRVVNRCVSGKWRPPLPDCIKYERCRGTPLVSNATASEKPNKHASYPHEYTVKYTCQPDLLQLGNNTVTCVNGKWTEPQIVCTVPSGTDQCRRKYVQNADVTKISATRYKVTCRIGHTLADDQTVFQCNAGEWLEQTPHCKPVTCPNIRMKYKILYGGRESTHGLVHGILVRVRCPAGQQPPDGIHEVRCDNGRWEPFRPVCRRYCTIRERFSEYSRFTHIRSNVNVKDEVLHGKVILQRCIGNQENTEKRMCVNGRWWPRLKLCKAPDNGTILPDGTAIIYSRLHGDDSSKCSLIPGNSFDFFSLDESILYDSEDVVNNGDTIKQVCSHTNNEPMNSHVIECQNGTWSPDLRACPDPDCDVYINSNDVLNGTLTSPGLESGFPRNTVCRYHFTLSKYEQVKVTFVKFDISGDMPSCTQSYLSSKSLDMFGHTPKYCGSELPPIIEAHGPEVVITLNTLRAKVVNFIATYEIVADDIECPRPDNDDLIYEPFQDRYLVNDVLKSIRCRDENSYLVGADMLFCQKNGTWNSSAKCVEYQRCTLPFTEGVEFYVEDFMLLSGEVKHGTSVEVFRECDDDVVSNSLDSIQVIECEDGTLSEDVIPCQNTTVVDEGYQCAPPSNTNIQFSPQFDVYLEDETVNVVECSDPLLQPVGARQLVCKEDGSWAGSVQCLSYCVNGVNYMRRTNYSFFLRKSGLQYHQIDNIPEPMDCYVECESYTGFICRSFEFREEQSICILLDGPPVDTHFIPSVTDSTRPRVYERACNDRCHIPELVPNDVKLFDQEGNMYVSKQAVLTGSIVKVTCQNSTKSEDMTCLGGAWGVVFDDDFC